MLFSVAVEETLLLLKIAFVVLLYVFIWIVVRTASRELRSPQESFVLAPHDPRAEAIRGGGGRPDRLVVLSSPSIEPGTDFRIDSAPLTLGRASQNDVALDGDDFASARHARIEPRSDGIWLEDDGSTNGTFVNGTRLTAPRRLAPGDVVRIGETDLRYER